MSTRAAVTVTPTFVLRRLDPERVLREYRSGFFSRLTSFPPKVALKTTTIVQKRNVVSQHGQGPLDQSYVFRDKNNVTQTIVTTNHNICNKPQPPYTCLNCRQQFDHDWIGVPIRMSEVQEDDEKKTHVGTDGCHCTFECVLSSIRRFYPSTRRYRDPLYMDAEQILRHLHALLYPDADPLREAQDTRLLQPNGPLPYEEWSQGKHRYYRTGSIILDPTKVQYLRS